MEKHIVPFEIAKILKDKGFDEKCLGVYQYRFDNTIEIRLFSAMGHYELFSNFTNGKWIKFSPQQTSKILYSELEEVYLAPLYQQVIDWFDSVHKIRIDLIHADSNGTHKFTIWKWNFDNQVGKWERLSYIGTFHDKVERNNKAIEEALKLI